MKRVREAAPLQVYLDAAERDRLERLADQLGTTRSDVVRRSLEALEREVTDPEGHPALRVIGMVRAETGSPQPDPAREHDRVLADGEESSWAPPRRKGRRRGR